MTLTDAIAIRDLAADELDAIKSYALENGRLWKADLAADWYNARAIGERGAILHALRNDPRWGHEGLRAFIMPAGVWPSTKRRRA